MKIKILYSKIQLEAAVKFLAASNPYFYNQDSYIRSSIIDHINELTINNESNFGGTMGYTLILDRSFEDIHNDINKVYIDILVDPSVGVTDMDWHEEIIRKK